MIRELFCLHSLGLQTFKRHARDIGVKLEAKQLKTMEVELFRGNNNPASVNIAAKFCNKSKVVDLLLALQWRQEKRKGTLAS